MQCLKQKKAAGDDLNATLKAWEARVLVDQEQERKKKRDEEDAKRQKAYALSCQRSLLRYCY